MEMILPKKTHSMMRLGVLNDLNELTATAVIILNQQADLEFRSPLDRGTMSWIGMENPSAYNTH
jgi:hypothetical protein